MIRWFPLLLLLVALRSHQQRTRVASSPRAPGFKLHEDWGGQRRADRRDDAPIASGDHHGAAGDATTYAGLAGVATYCPSRRTRTHITAAAATTATATADGPASSDPATCS